MVFVRGNAAIRDHAKDGKALHLFEAPGRTLVRYLGEATYLGHHLSQAPDRIGQLRHAIVFELELEGVDGEVASIDLDRQVRNEPSGLWKKGLAELRGIALGKSPRTAKATERKAKVYQRSLAGQGLRPEARRGHL